MVEERKEYVSLEELCEERVGRDIVETFLPRYGKYIKHRARVPLDVLLRAQRRFMSGRRKDVEGFFVFLLRYLLVKPRIEDDRQAKALLKADGRVMLEIIGQAIGNVSDMVEEVEPEAGE
ncbi:MAG TPA: hypothetical protein EYH32_00400 [Anaerolineae bacterium]|nr:hypothetical protein [Anaerolineae bacterium]